MLYRDLIPDRLGGAVIASHIRLPEGGPVPDYVHFHDICFQIIYCRSGWVRVVYEDQGEPFVMAPGDCVLQPPRIRHRVLACGDGTEVIEIGCPAEHMTRVARDCELPNGSSPGLEYRGQQFVRSLASEAVYEADRLAGFRVRDTGIERATKGFGRVWVLRPGVDPGRRMVAQDQDFCFGFVIGGSLTLSCEGTHRVQASDAFTIPRDKLYALTEPSPDLSLLMVSIASL